jgi:hypothetical protein
LLRKITGRPCQVRVEYVGNGAAANPAEAAADAGQQPSRYRRQRAEALQEPLLKRAIDVLGAQVIHVDDGFGAAPAAVPERPEGGDAEES